METNALNHGQLLKDWVHFLQIKPKTLLERLGYGSNYENLYYWYSREEIKLSQLKKWADALQLSTDQLLSGPGAYRSATSELAEGEVPYRLHHGKQLKKIIEDRHTKITQLATTINYTRQNVYDMFERATIDPDTLTKLAKFFNVPLAYFVGGGATRGFFAQNENEAFQAIEVMLNTKQAETLAAIEAMFKKYVVKGN